MLRFTKGRNVNNPSASAGAGVVVRKRRRPLIRVVLMAALLGASIGLLAALWKATPALTWAVRQSICPSVEKVDTVEVAVSTTDAVIPTVEIVVPSGDGLFCSLQTVSIASRDLREPRFPKSTFRVCRIYLQAWRSQMTTGY